MRRDSAAKHRQVTHRRGARPPIASRGRPWWRAWTADTPAGGRLASLLWIVGLVGLVLGLALAFHFGQQARQAEKAFQTVWQKALDLDQEGATFYRLRLPAGAWPNYQWEKLFEGGLDWPDGPLPGKNRYKIKALSGLELETPQKLSFHLVANDAVSMFLNGELIFDQWRPWPGNIDAHFTTEAPAGRVLLEIDYVRVRGHGGLTLDIRDEAGRSLVSHPLLPGVDAQAWLKQRTRREALKKRQRVSLALALLLGLAPLFYKLLRHGDDLVRLAQGLRPWAVGFWLGFWLALLRQMMVYLPSDEGDDLVLMLGAPLAAGLAGALLQAFLSRAPAQRAQVRLQRLQRWWLAHEPWLLPGLAFLALVGFYYGAIANQGGSLLYNFLDAPWDARQYKDIATNWYWMRRNDLGGVWGNYPWHPFFPALARGFILLGVDPSWALLLVAWPMAIAAYYLLHRVARRLWGAETARWALLALACYPCAWYLLIGYPYSTALTLGLAYFLALHSQRYGLACLFGYFLGMTYPTGVLCGVLPLFMLAPRIARAENPWPELGRMLLAGVGPALGLMTYCLHHWWAFNDFWLPISGHANWGRQANWPWLSLIDGILAEPPHYPEAINALLVVVTLLVFGHRFRAELWTLLLAVWLCGPATGDLESVYRQNILLWPLFLMVATSSRPRWLKAAWLWLWVYFAIKWYLPLWLAGDLV